MVDGTDAVMDSAMYIRNQDGQKVLVAVRPIHNPDIGPTPDRVPDISVDYTDQVDYSQSADMEINVDQSNTIPANKFHYMKEFVSRVDSILHALQAKEAMSDPPICAKCLAESGAEWRCEDCVGGMILCRHCMRQSHLCNPFHHIQFWTGTHFRKAALWEVGVYLTLPHQTAPGICSHIEWQQQMLEKYQKTKDTIPHYHSPIEPIRIDQHPSESDPTLDRDAALDAADTLLLDQLLGEKNIGNVCDEGGEEDLTEETNDLQDGEAGACGFTKYMDQSVGDQRSDSAAASVPNIASETNEHMYDFSI